MTRSHDPHPFRAPLGQNLIGARRETAFELAPDATARAAIARHLGISEIRKLRFAGRVTPAGRRDWRLEAELGATVVQPCVVTLAPVVTRIDTPVVRRFLAEWHEPEAGEVERPEDETAEPLESVIDPGLVMVEALALALPDYPRAPGAELGAVQVTPPGAEPLDDDALRPFAGLAGLRRDREI
jgi:uncharacterized metal-binding protein YceD (DUF177 family)